jgi:hypothetical protein
MGGAAVSSADTGAFSSGIELKIQRSNPEMQNVLLMPSVDWWKATTTQLSIRSRSWRTLKLSFGIMEDTGGLLI